MRGKLVEDIATCLEAAIERRVTPGAVVAVARRDRLLAEVAVGRETYADDAAPIREDSLYDLASLTKVCATTPTLLRLVDRGEIDLDQTVNSILPVFRDERREEVTIRHLLTHSSGLPAHRPFYQTCDSKETLLAAVLETALESAPGSTYRYSDLGMILLMACLEKVSGEAFEDLARREVFAPLQMQSAVFARGGGLKAVPTEEDAWRGRLIHGEVHDENAAVMGGVSGHAGLFASAADVARLGVAFLGGGRGWISPKLARLATQRDGRVPGSSRALGWDSFEAGGSGGDLLSTRAFGHTGFTGASIWCDPDSDLCIVLLTNRVHPSREGRGIQELRGEIADLVMRSRESWRD
jgi:CubicO group peptidase (beta-lactamase class C family)